MTEQARKASRRPTDDAAGVLLLCSVFLLGRGVVSWHEAQTELAVSFWIRAGLLVPAAFFVWRQRRWAVIATMAVAVFDGLRVIVHAVDAQVFPSFLGIWVRLVLLWLLALCWKDLA